MNSVRTATDFNLTPADREWLIESGYRAAKEFLEDRSWESYVEKRLTRTS